MPSELKDWKGSDHLLFSLEEPGNDPNCEKIIYTSSFLVPTRITTMKITYHIPNFLLTAGNPPNK